jgi:glycine oxidase
LSANSKTFDVAIVGGGVIGLSVAWRAAGRGLRVVVLDRDQPGAGASHVAAGMLAPITEAHPAERQLLELGLRSAAMYPAFIAELIEASELDPGYTSFGSLVVARDRDEAEALDREFEMRRELGLEVARLRPTEARRLEPALAPTLRLALSVEQDRAVDPRRLTSALLAAAERAGAVVMPRSEVARLVIRDDRARGVELAGGESIVADQVVIAAGAWSNAVAGLPPTARVSVRPVKGQILRLRDPSGPGLLTHVLRMSQGYLVPRPDGSYVLGATMEERGFDTTVTAGAVFELLRDAIELVPGLTELSIDELSAGLRPGTADNAPVIGPGAIAGLHWATGHYRNGVLLAPITAAALAAELCGEHPGPELEPFSPSRFTPAPLALVGAQEPS